MKIRVFDTPHEAGIYVAALAERVILETPRPVLGLATGSTSIPFYEGLVRFHQCGLDLSHVVTINLDEYIGLPPDHEQSYHAFMEQHLFSKVNIQPDNRYLPRGWVSDLEAECARYDAIIEKHPIDFQILGIGTNGHIGFNEPSHSLLSKTHVVELSPATIESNARFFKNSAEVPKRAITMGVQSILQAKQIVLMAFGANKAKVVARAVCGRVSTDIPASLLQLHRDVTIVLDHQSAQELPEFALESPENGRID